MKSSACGHKLSCDLGTTRIYEVYIVTQHACSYMILLAPFCGEMSISDLVSSEIKVVSLGLTRPHEAEPVYNRIVCEPFVYSDSHPTTHGIGFFCNIPLPSPTIKCFVRVVYIHFHTSPCGIVHYYIPLFSPPPMWNWLETPPHHPHIIIVNRTPSL